VCRTTLPLSNPAMVPSGAPRTLLRTQMLLSHADLRVNQNAGTEETLKIRTSGALTCVIDIVEAGWSACSVTPCVWHIADAILGPCRLGCWVVIASPAGVPTLQGDVLVAKTSCCCHTLFRRDVWIVPVYPEWEHRHTACLVRKASNVACTPPTQRCHSPLA
jgi:hypothetical protein